MLSSGLNTWSTQQMHTQFWQKKEQTDKSDMQYWDFVETFYYQLMHIMLKKHSY